MLVQRAAAAHGVRPKEYLQWPRHERVFIETALREWMREQPMGFLG